MVGCEAWWILYKLKSNITLLWLSSLVEHKIILEAKATTPFKYTSLYKNVKMLPQKFIL